jgi:hypothetical protein
VLLLSFNVVFAERRLEYLSPSQDDDDARDVELLLLER